MTDVEANAVLALQQSALLRAIWPGDWQALPHLAPDIPKGAPVGSHANDRGLHAYRAHALAQAEGALMAVYPVVTQIMGATDAALLARALWHHYPPNAGDLAAWGGDLPVLIESDTQLAEVPYLADLARLEWLLHTAAALPDRRADLSTLAHLADADAEQWCARWAPGLAVLCSSWPVVSIWQAHQPARDADAEAEAESQTNGAVRCAMETCLFAPQPEAAVVWRNGFKPCVRHALSGEAHWLASIDRKQPLVIAIDRAADLDVAVWLPLAVTTGLLLALDPVTPAVPVTLTL
jgi:Putative DNA-binding domain